MLKEKTLEDILEEIRLLYPEMFRLQETTENVIKQICITWLEEQKFQKVREEIQEILEKESVVDGPFIFQIKNHQGVSCGTPPRFDDLKNTYFSYFENEFREQNIYLYHYPTQQGFVYVADAGWEHPRRVTSQGLTPMGMAMGEEETLWLRACWIATGGKYTK